MSHQQNQSTASIKSEIARLQQRLEELLGESPRMDDEVNAVEPDLRALISLFEAVSVDAP
jgi:archaellum component FlaC